MSVSFKSLSGLSKWLIFWLKIYVLANLLFIPHSLWTTYSMQSMLAEHESSERELRKLLESEDAGDEEYVLSDGEVHNDILITSQSLESDDTDAEVPKEQADFVTELHQKFFLVSNESGSDQHVQSDIITTAASEEGDGEGDTDDLIAASFLFLTVWDLAEFWYIIVLGIVLVTSYAISGIVFLKWVYRTNRNIGLFASMKPYYSPSWAAWSFVVPVANIVNPPYIMKELYTIASKGATNSLVGGWWLLVVVDFLASKLYLKSIVRSRSNSFAFGAYQSLVIDLLFLGISAAVGYATLRLVQQISVAYATNIRESLEEASQSTPELA